MRRFVQTLDLDLNDGCLQRRPESPWVMALVWGVVASWWAGAIAGFSLALVNLRTQLPALRILRMVAVACGVVWVLVMVVLASVYVLSGFFSLDSFSASFGGDRRLIAVNIAHRCMYLFAALGTFVVAVKMSLIRHRESTRC